MITCNFGLYFGSFFSFSHRVDCYQIRSFPLTLIIPYQAGHFCVVSDSGAEPGRGHRDGDAHPRVVVRAVVVHDGALQLMGQCSKYEK